MATIYACAEPQVDPLSPLQPQRSDVKHVAATGGTCGDDRSAILAGIASLANGETLRLTGDFEICAPIDITKSNLRITGGGTASIHQKTMGQHVFRALGSPTSFLTNITVDSLNFSGEEYVEAQGQAHLLQAMALFVRNVDGVTFRNNKVTYLGLFESDHNGGRPYTQFTPPAQSRNIQVTDNEGIGRSTYFPFISGVIIGYARDALVARNRLSHYWSGILWWGGNGNPDVADGAPTNPRYARDIRIEANDVRVTQAGIWGSMGDSVTVTGWNYVETCYDVCLDAEGSSNVTFEKTTAKFARYATLAVFFHSKNIIFRDLAVEQDGRRTPGDSAVWNAMFRTTSPGSGNGKGISVDIHNNFMNYTGNGVGIVTKGPSESFRFNANRLKNTVIGLPQDRNGAIAIENNLLEIDRQTRFYSDWTDSIVPAIRVAHNYLENGDPMSPISAQYELTIVANRILSPSVQTKPGIMVQEPNHPDVNALISLNSIQGFPSSLSLSWGSQGQKTFDVVDNGATAAIPTKNWSGTSSGNFIIDPQPNIVGYTVRGPTYLDWQPMRYGFETAGSTGQSRDLTQLRVLNVKQLSSVQICVRTYVEGIGWTTTTAGAPCGWDVTVGSTSSGRIQAVQMWLKPGTFGSGGTICYQTHVGNVGWQSQKCNGLTAGVTSTNAIQAIRIRVSGI